jgi:hypothetical protein
LSPTGFSIDAQVAGPEGKFARVRVDQPSTFVVGLICQCGGDLLNVDGVQIQHPPTVGREWVTCIRKRLTGRVQLAATRRGLKAIASPSQAAPVSSCVGQAPRRRLARTTTPTARTYIAARAVVSTAGTKRTWPLLME